MRKSNVMLMSIITPQNSLADCYELSIKVSLLMFVSSSLTNAAEKAIKVRDEWITVLSGRFFSTLFLFCFGSHTFITAVNWFTGGTWWHSTSAESEYLDLYHKLPFDTAGVHQTVCEQNGLHKVTLNTSKNLQHIILFFLYFETMLPLTL